MNTLPEPTANLVYRYIYSDIIKRRYFDIRYLSRNRDAFPLHDYCPMHDNYLCKDSVWCMMLRLKTNAFKSKKLQ